MADRESGGRCTLQSRDLPPACARRMLGNQLRRQMEIEIINTHSFILGEAILRRLQQGFSARDGPLQ